MKIVRPHNTTREAAIELVNQMLPIFLGQAGNKISELHYYWEGHSLFASFKAASPVGSLPIKVTFEVTPKDIIIESKLPLRARVMEGRIRAEVERELDKHL